MSEFKTPLASKRGGGGGYAGSAGGGEVVALDAVSMQEQPRFASGLGELDRVLGGGLVPGSAILIGGEPGIGKSTLLLQVVAAVAQQQSVLYVTGEESLQQVALRARRLGLDPKGLNCMAETHAEEIFISAGRQQPALMVVDSIQTLYADDISSAPGSVSQVRECAARLTRLAKQSGCVLFLVGHVTKEGSIAGPRVLEHMVDTVLYFESDSGSRYRMLRAVKNRFGAVNELGVFAMGDEGLREVANPSAIFLSQRDQPVPGSAVLVTREGTRPLMVEVQALVDENRYGNPRRVAVGVEANRLLLLLAVMHRHSGIQIHDQDVFINVVGGLRVQETAADLALLLAVWSSLRGRPLPIDLAAFGEIGLSGELRPVPNGEERMRAAAGQGFRTILLPKANARGLKPPQGVRLIGCDRISAAFEAISEA
ncbi:MAG: DNA repair protein RadA [Wenzhouxiangellaceae bacterium]